MRTTAASMWTYNVYGTVNITDHFGTQVGYRSIDVNYQADRDTGSLQMRGLYFSGVVRFSGAIRGARP